MKHAREMGTIIAITILLQFCAAGAIGQMIGPNFVFPQCGKFEDNPVVAAQGNLVLATWRMSCDGAYRVTVSRDGGGSWLDSKPLFRNTAQPPAAICAGDSNRFYLACQVQDFGRSMEFHEGRLVGSVFQWRRLSNPLPMPFGESATTEGVNETQVRFDPVTRNIYITFTHVGTFDGVDGYRITFVRSTDSGFTWSTPMELTGPESNGAQPVVGMAGELAVVWENYVTKMLEGRRSADGGATFGPVFEIGPIHDNVALVPSAWWGNGGSGNPAYPWAASMSAPPAFSVAVDRSNGPRRGTRNLSTTLRHRLREFTEQRSCTAPRG